MTISKEETFKEISNTIVNVVKTYSLNSEKQIDDKYKIQFSHSVFILTKIFTLLKIVIDRPDQSQVSDEKFESQTLIWQACNSMLAAIQLIRQGYPLEPQFLMRVAIESFSLALSFHVDEKAFSKYSDGKLSGNKSITIAKKAVSELGQIYGILSTVTHPSKRTTVNNYNEISKSIIIGGGFTNDSSNRTLFNYSLLNYLLLTIWKGTELIFFDFEDIPSLWKETNDGYILKQDNSIKEIVINIEKGFKDAILSINDDLKE